MDGKPTLTRKGYAVPGRGGQDFQERDEVRAGEGPAGRGGPRAIR